MEKIVKLNGINYLNKNIILCGIRFVILKIFYEFYLKVKMKEFLYRKL